jgi:hypothetical protein
MINPLKKFGLKAIAFAMTVLLLGSLVVAPSYALEGFDLDSLNGGEFGITATPYDAEIYTEDLMFLGIFGVVWALMFIPMYIYYALSLMTIAKKLNVPNAWLAWIPIANIVLFFQCAGLSPWLTILMLIPGLNIIGLIFMVYGYMKIAERRGFQSWLGLLIIVPVVGFIIPGYLAWAEAKGETV